ncbi:uncharacterized protein LOC123518179 [Portunus trituberculatus]|uniref:uncharacterized protein LOC123518179 n=1 Tax=Portunus trituberculatus TaxID=210409 RepID=UPI001E1D174C|nr:uncharacterized protein LOC123518179 [Portunus trituberculatus]
MTVLRHSTNPAFITTVLGHLKVSTLEEAELRLEQHLWSILHKHLQVELPPDVAEELATLPLLPHSSPSRTCTTRERSNHEDGTCPTDLLPAPEDCSQLLTSLPLGGELFGSATNSSQGHCEPQGEDSNLLQFDLALVAASEPISQGHELSLEGRAAENHVQSDIERLCGQVLSNSAREEPEGHHPLECSRLDGSAAEYHVQTDIERLCNQVWSNSAQEDLVEGHSTLCNSPVTSPRQPEAMAIHSPPGPSPDCHEEVFERSQDQKTEIEKQEPHQLDGENDSSPAAAKNKILKVMQLLSGTIEEGEDLASQNKRIEEALENLSYSLALDTQTQPYSLTPSSLTQSSIDIHPKEVTDNDQEKNVGAEPVKNQILEALALLSSTLSLPVSLQTWSQTPPSSSSQGSPSRQLLSGLSQECRTEHEPPRLQESDTLISVVNREVLDIERVAPRVDQRPLNDTACMVPNPTPALRVRRDLWSGEQTTVTSETRHVSGCHSSSQGKGDDGDEPQANAWPWPLASGSGEESWSIVVPDANPRSLFCNEVERDKRSAINLHEERVRVEEASQPFLAESSTWDILLSNNDGDTEYASSVWNTEISETSEVAQPNLALEAGPSRLSIVQREKHLSSQPSLPPTSSHAVPQVTQKRKRNKSLDKSLCRPPTKRMRVPKPKAAVRLCHEPAATSSRRKAPAAHQGGGGGCLSTTNAEHSQK